MMLGALIPVCAYEMSKKKCFEDMKMKASKIISDMTQKCGCQKNTNTPNSNEAQ